MAVAGAGLYRRCADHLAGGHRYDERTCALRNSSLPPQLGVGRAVGAGAAR